MLKKLLKYDLEYMYKSLFLFYGVTIVSAIFTRIFGSLGDAFIFDVINKLLNFTTVAMMFCVAFVSVIRMWIRFKNNLYGDESYLTHTLPVTKKQLYTSKFLTSVIIILSSLIVLVVTYFIGYVKSMEEIKTLWEVFTLDGAAFLLLVILIFLMILGCIHSVQLGYTGIILGNRRNNNKLAWSVVFGFIVYFITQVINAIVMISFVVNKQIRDFLFTSVEENMGVEGLTMHILNIMFGSIFILYVIYVIALYFINNKFLKKGVNVD